MSTYNGWKNYETWAVALWIDNDQGSQEYWREEAGEEWETAAGSTHDVFTPSEAACFALAERLKAHHEENAPEATGVYADLLNAALGEVEWADVADHLLQGLDSEFYVPRGK